LRTDDQRIEADRKSMPFIVLSAAICASLRLSTSATGVIPNLRRDRPCRSESTLLSGMGKLPQPCAVAAYPGIRRYLGTQSFACSFHP
ncbi:MAG: hypothetical protein AB8B34_10020, partial [Prochlorococcus sp.]